MVTGSTIGYRVNSLSIDWENKSKVWNKMFSYDALFLRKSSLKIYRAYLNLVKYRLSMSKQLAGDYHTYESK